MPLDLPRNIYLFKLEMGGICVLWTHSSIFFLFYEIHQNLIDKDQVETLSNNIIMLYCRLYKIVSDCCLMPTHQFSSYIMVRNKLIILPLVERGLYCNHLVRPSVFPSVHTFVTDISASTGRNDFIFDIWLWHGDLYRVSPFQVYHTSTSCLPCDLQMNEWGYSYHDVACNILFSMR